METKDNDVLPHETPIIFSLGILYLKKPDHNIFFSASCSQ